MLRVDPTPHRAADHLGKSVGVACAIAGGLFERFHQRRPNIVEHSVVWSKTTSVNFWPHDNSPGLGVNGQENRNKPFLGKDSAVLEVGVRNLPHRRAIDVHETNVQLAGHRGHPTGHVDDGAVFADQG